MDQYTRLAKQTVDEYVKHRNKLPVPADLPEEFYARRAGVFVTLHSGDDLRGCIGTILPVRKNIAEEIIANAISACSRDNRFEPVSEDELPDLNYEVSILNEPQPVDDLASHDPKKSGIIVQCADGRCGLLLPDLAGIDTAEEQLAIACRKGGIDFARDESDLFSFTVEKHI